MFHYKIVISYKGTNYAGWQTQPRRDKSTIQESIHQVLKKITKYQECIVSGASRTDAGVHAKGQVARICIALNINCEKLLMGMNSLLPSDIRILKCVPSSIEFNPNKDALLKEYHYYFYTGQCSDPIIGDVAVYINGELDLKLMNKAAGLFVGRYDFYNFSKRDPNVGSTIREVVTCEVVKTDFGALLSEIYCLRVVGPGFLKQMVRYMASAIINVGQEKMKPLCIEEHLGEHYENKLVRKAKAHGLYLMHIEY